MMVPPKQMMLLAFLACNLLATGQTGMISAPVKTTYDLVTRSRDTLVMDTLTSGSQIYHPLYSVFPSWQELGNLGFPAIPTKWNGIGHLNEPFYITSIRQYTNPSDKLIQYQSNKPYALLNYTSGGTKDIHGQFIRAIFARPVTPSFRFTALLDFVNSPGHYTNQAANQSSFTLNAEIRKARYRLDAGLERLQFKLGENGGVLRSEDLLLPKYAIRSTVPVHMKDAGSSTSLMIIQGRQEYNLFMPANRDSTDSTGITDLSQPKPRPILFHRFNYELSQRLYKDKQNAQMGFYKDFFFLPDEAQDSMMFNTFDNQVGLIHSGTIRDSLGWMADAGIYNGFSRWSTNEFSGNFLQLGAFANAKISSPLWLLQIHAKMQLLGYGLGTYHLNLELGRKNLFNRWDLSVTAESRIDRPSVFYQVLSGNHDHWFQSMKNQQEQNAGLQIREKNWDLVAGVQVSMISNWVYFDTLAHPAQTSYSTVVGAVFLSKSFQAGPFRSVNSLRLQYTGAAEIPLPGIVASTSTFLHHDIVFAKTGGKLEVEYGFDVRYCSSYQGYAYQPSTGAFYLQTHTKMGNYPFADLFLTLRVKRTRVFIKWEHVNAGLTGQSYFPVLNYPVKERFLKYGVYWHFYD